MIKRREVFTGIMLLSNKLLLKKKKKITVSSNRGHKPRKVEQVFALTAAQVGHRKKKKKTK